MKASPSILKAALLAGVALAAVSWHAKPGTPKPQKVRLARLVVDSTQLARYKALLKEGVEAAVQKEPGVLTLYAVFEQKRPNHVTILEVYADEAAYQAHLNTPHFMKYKQGTSAMVQQLELVETDPLIPELKIK
ncbi:antibiotic biosynthesis monooxygenase [Hymenobacter sp. BT683]|uniref:Antibiotic biosynthesis monooxygenase n=1 Tax=Hymenobacter jeongseonensis TaxID=2791027 RepID=A0ABS0INP6_9BACT|nr:antibiotic biosynthesis monooxygenase [Hymenobacter jeongseonensis]MBF9239999.1 antibiotic biosynthesis monooxygenase [Hymenobacter jeongseonensis]